MGSFSRRAVAEATEEMLRRDWRFLQDVRWVSWVFLITHIGLRFRRKGSDFQFSVYGPFRSWVGLGRWVVYIGTDKEWMDGWARKGDRSFSRSLFLIFFEIEMTSQFNRSSWKDLVVIS